MGQRDGIVAGLFTSMGVNGRELCGRSAIWQLDVPYNATPNGHGVTKSMPIFSFFGATVAILRYPAANINLNTVPVMERNPPRATAQLT